MREIFKHINNFFSTERIELIILLMAVLIGVIGGITYSVSVGKYSQAINLIPASVVFLGVLVALDNLVTTEKAREKDRAREESRFRYDVCLKQLERLEEALSPAKETYGVSLGLMPRGWSKTQLKKSLMIIDAYTDLKKAISEEHLAALDIEEMIYKDLISSMAKRQTGFDYFVLLDNNDFSKKIDDRLAAHNKRLLELEKEGNYVNYIHWKTSIDTPLPHAIPLSLLLELVNFIAEFSPPLSINSPEFNPQELEFSIRNAGFEGISDYINWYYRANHEIDGTISLSKNLYKTNATST